MDKKIYLQLLKQRKRAREELREAYKLRSLDRLLISLIGEKKYREEIKKYV